jgi:hypothetical protein
MEGYIKWILISAVGIAVLLSTLTYIECKSEGGKGCLLKTLSRNTLILD